ncbi:hypothetical protein Btru_032818 [Bulinus truncatus]|nr:hypothetical protein Btru_032818 [Bulinus truncatus]
MDVTCHLAVGISKCLNKFIEGEDDVFYDFTVEVEEEQFRCHKFILGACSLFFQGLFRSKMKETESNKVSVEDISCGTFKLIRDVLYSSADVITEENLFDIWHAAHQLQIQFLVEECENFAVRILSLENYDEIFEHAFILESKKVFIGIADFINENFKVCKSHETVLKLNGEEFVRIVQSNELDSGTEDFVIDVIIKWMNYNCENRNTDNSRKRKGVNLSSIKLNVQRMADVKETQSVDVETIPGYENQTNKNCSNKEINSALEDMEYVQKELQEDDRQKNIQQRTTNYEIKKMENTTTDSCSNKDIHCEVSGIETISCLENQTDGEEMCTEDEGTEDMQKDEEGKGRHDKTTVQPNPRAKYVTDILAAARLSLASEDRLKRLHQHKLVVDNKDARDILFNACLYRNRGSFSTEWPTCTIPRKNYHNEIVVFLHTKNISYTETYSFQMNESAIFPSCTEIRYNCNFTIVMGQIYAVGYTEKNESSLCVFLYSQNKWLKINRVGHYCSDYYFSTADNVFSLIPQNNFLYLIKEQQKLLLRLDLLTVKNFEEFSKVPTEDPIQYVTSYKHMILVFCSVTDDSSNKTMALSYDTISNKWTTSCSFEGLSQNMTSFEINNETYLLMSDGDIYIIQLNDQNVIDFIFVTKIWTEAVRLYGAINYNNTLHIFSAKKITVLATVETLFKNTLFHVTDEDLRYTRCLCVPKSLLESAPDRQKARRKLKRQARLEKSDLANNFLLH